MNNGLYSIAIYCVNFHSYEYLLHYLVSIDKSAEAVASRTQISVFIADNSSPTQFVDYEPMHFTLHVVPTGKNMGYFGAIRFAMQQYDPTDFDYSILSNVDVVLSDHFFSSLLNVHTSPQRAWIAPSILSQTQHFDFNPQALNRYSYKKMRLLRLMFKYPVLLRLKQKLLHMYHDVKVSQPATIYAGHGSFIILTNIFFVKCGIIDYPVFLYGEEIYLAETCRKNNLLVEYAPSIKVFDIGRVSTGQIPSKTYCKYNYQAINFIIKQFYSSV